MNAYEQLEQMGMEKGIEKGTLNTMLRQLRKRFGTLEEITLTLLGRLPLEQLEELSEAALDFKTKADLEDWLSQQQPQN